MTEEELLTGSLKTLGDAALDDAELDWRVTSFENALRRMRGDAAEAARIDALVRDAELGQPDSRITGGDGNVVHVSGENVTVNCGHAGEAADTEERFNTALARMLRLAETIEEASAQTARQRPRRIWETVLRPASVVSVLAVLAAVTVLATVHATASAMSVIGITLAAATAAVAGASFWMLWTSVRELNRRGDAHVALGLLLGRELKQENAGHARAAAEETDRAPAAADHPGNRAEARIATSGQNCTIVLTDVVGFSGPERDDEARRIIRQATMAMTRLALGPVWDASHREDRGDGHLIVVPPDISTAQVIDQLVTVLPRQLRIHNRRYSDQVRIQLRVAVDVGPVADDGMGMSGRSIIQTARMLEAPAFKAAMIDHDAVLGVAVSPFIYQAHVGSDGSSLDPDGYIQVPVQVKGASGSAWVQLVGPTGIIPSSRRQLVS